MKLSKTMVEALTIDTPLQFRRVRTLRALKSRGLVSKIHRANNNGFYPYNLTAYGRRVRRELLQLSPKVRENIFG